MFTDIKWKEFTVNVGVMVFAYYDALFSIFNRKNIFNRFGKINSGGILLNFQDELRSSGNGNEISTDPEISEFFNVVNDLQDEIMDILNQAGSKKFVREEIILQIQTVLLKYNSLKFSPFKNAINKYIVTECQNNCCIRLDAHDTNRFWLP